MSTPPNKPNSTPRRLFADVARAAAAANAQAQTVGDAPPADAAQPAMESEGENRIDEELGDDSQATQIEPSGEAEDVVGPEAPPPSDEASTASPTRLRSGKTVSTQSPLKRTRSVAAQHACPTTDVLDDVAGLRERVGALEGMVDELTDGLQLSRRNEREFVRQIAELQDTADEAFNATRAIQSSNDALRASLADLQASNEALRATLVSEVEPNLQAVIDPISSVTATQTQLLANRTAAGARLDEALDRLDRIEREEGEGPLKRKRTGAAQAPLFRIGAGGLSNRSPGGAEAGTTAANERGPQPVTPTRRTATAPPPSYEQATHPTTPTGRVASAHPPPITSGGAEQQARAPHMGPRMPTWAQRAPSTPQQRSQPRAPAATQQGGGGRMNAVPQVPMQAAPPVPQVPVSRQQAEPESTTARQGVHLVKIGPLPGNLPIAENAARAWLGALPNRSNLANKVREARLSLDFRFIYITMTSKEVARVVVRVWNEMPVPPVVGAEAEIYVQEN
ncbi:hypothetical protein DFP72DRAFT_1099946 [Ephemerocybe angulata]|uniref:Uncharacterized protein n=1 Tax=Ephemerocybe angulata TaxID=980116 RepID=A0A8H6HC57_9AGAR|nr:hypothetical protein DFP72DRAFT_1099946 [Tulosesus angulatus]